MGICCTGVVNPDGYFDISSCDSEQVIIEKLEKLRQVKVKSEIHVCMMRFPSPITSDGMRYDRKYKVFLL
jgi:hypothetical protein